MKKLVESALENLSSKEVFLFRVTCASCGAEYGNRPTKFSKANEVCVTQSRRVICEVLYEQEMTTARQTAVRVAAEQMNYCPVCKRLVCNQCFLICEELDMCSLCATRLEQRGNPVLSEVVDAAM